MQNVGCNNGPLSSSKAKRLSFSRVVVRAGHSPIFVGRFSCRKRIGPSPQHNQASAKMGSRRVRWLRRIGLVGLVCLKSIMKLLQPTMHLQNTGRRNGSKLCVYVVLQFWSDHLLKLFFVKRVFSFLYSAFPPGRRVSPTCGSADRYIPL